VQDGVEPGLGGVEVEITDSAGITQTVTTGDNGDYSATVPAGDTDVNIVDATLPANLTQTEGTDPTTVTVPSGGTASDIDGYQPPCPASVEVACAKCGKILECYVDLPEGFGFFFNETKEYIEDVDSGFGFCGSNGRTCNNQQCDGKQGIMAYRSSDIPQSCPDLGSFRCHAGNNSRRRGAALSNWGTYKIVLDDECLPTTDPDGCSDKCESEVCPCDFAETFCSGCNHQESPHNDIFFEE